MKKTTKNIVIGIVSAVLVASLIVIIVILLPKLKKEEVENDLRTKLETLVVDYYENEFEPKMPDFLDNYGSLTVTLDYLQGLEKDIKLFEDNDCDYSGTYVTLTKVEDEEPYKIDVVLACGNDK